MKNMYLTKSILTAGVFSFGLLSGCAADKVPEQKPVVQVKRGGVSYTSAGLNELMIKQAIAGSKFEVASRGDSFVITMPAKSSFNARRPDVLLPATLTPLTKIAKLVSQDPNWVVVIAGHTDTSGNAVANDELSLQRAKSVSSIFSIAGFSRSRVYTVGVGAAQPIAKNTTAKGREENRRVELIIAPKTAGDISTLSNLYAVTKYQRNN